VGHQKGSITLGGGLFWGKLSTRARRGGTTRAGSKGGETPWGRKKHSLRGSYFKRRNYERWPMQRLLKLKKEPEGEVTGIWEHPLDKEILRVPKHPALAVRARVAHTTRLVRPGHVFYWGERTQGPTERAQPSKGFRQSGSILEKRRKA